MTAHERTSYDDRIRQSRRLTEFRLLGYEENNWVLLRLGGIGRRLHALTEVHLVHIQSDKSGIQNLIRETTCTGDCIKHSHKAMDQRLPAATLGVLKKVMLLGSN